MQQEVGLGVQNSQAVQRWGTSLDLKENCLLVRLNASFLLHYFPDRFQGPGGIFRPLSRRVSVNRSRFKSSCSRPPSLQHIQLHKYPCWMFDQYECMCTQVCRVCWRVSMRAIQLQPSLAQPPIWDASLSWMLEEYEQACEKPRAYEEPGSSKPDPWKN